MSKWNRGARETKERERQRSDRGRGVQERRE